MSMGLYAMLVILWNIIEEHPSYLMQHFILHETPPAKRNDPSILDIDIDIDLPVPESSSGNRAKRDPCGPLIGG